MNERPSRAVVRIALGIAQLGLATAAVVTWSQSGMSRYVIALGALAAAAVIASLALFRSER